MGIIVYQKEYTFLCGRYTLSYSRLQVIYQTFPMENKSVSSI